MVLLAILVAQSVVLFNGVLSEKFSNKVTLQISNGFPINVSGIFHVLVSFHFCTALISALAK